MGGGGQPFVPTDSNYLLKLVADKNGIYDISNTPSTFANLSNTKSGKFGKRAISSLENNSGYAYKTPSINISTSEDYTVSYWVKNLVTNGSCVFGMYPDMEYVYYEPSRSHSIELWWGGNIIFAVPTTSISPDNIYNNSSWVHHAFCRKNGVLSFFFNGSLIYSSSESRWEFSTSRTLYFLQDQWNKNIVTGDFDDVCIIKGIALWENDFTPPNDYLPSVLQS